MAQDRITRRTAPTPRFGIARVTLHIVQRYLAEDATVAVAEDDYTCTPKCKRAQPMMSASFRTRPKPRTGCARNGRRLPSNHVPAKPAYDEPRKNRAAER